MPPAQTKALRGMWMSVTLEDSASMVDLLDANRDGAITIDELRRFVYLLPEAQVCAFPAASLLHVLQPPLALGPLSPCACRGATARPRRRTTAEPHRMPVRGCIRWRAFPMPARQATPNNIVYALVDSSEWMHGVELRLCMTPPKQPFQRCAPIHRPVPGPPSPACSIPSSTLVSWPCAALCQSSFCAGCTDDLQATAACDMLQRMRLLIAEEAQQRRLLASSSSTPASAMHCSGPPAFPRAGRMDSPEAARHNPC